MSCHRTAVFLTIVAAAGVLGTSAGWLLDQGGTYAYFTDSTSISIRVAVGRHAPSPSNQPSAAPSGSEYGREPADHGHQQTSPAPSADDQPTSEPPDPRPPTTDPTPSASTGPPQSAELPKDGGRGAQAGPSNRTPSRQAGNDPHPSPIRNRRSPTPGVDQGFGHAGAGRASNVSSHAR